MKKGKKVIGIALILFSITALIFWEKWGKTYLLYDEVLVLTSDVKRGTVITENIIEERKMDITEKDCLRKKDANTIIGKETVQYIHKGTPLFSPYFDQRGLVATADKDKYVISLPENWLMSVPYSVQRGDKLYLYSGGKLVTWARVSSFNREEKELEIIVFNEQAETINQIIERGNKFIATYN